MTAGKILITVCIFTTYLPEKSMNCITAGKEYLPIYVIITTKNFSWKSGIIQKLKLGS